MKRKIDKSLGENMVVTSIYVNGAVLTELKKKLAGIGKSFNEELDGWIKDRLFQLNGHAPGGIGTPEEAHAKYESLKQEHLHMIAETSKTKHWLEEQRLFDDGVRLFGEVLGYDVGNAYDDSKCQTISVNFIEAASEAEFKDVTAKFLVRAIKKGKSQLGHVFASYVENVRARKQVERQLFAFRVDHEVNDPEESKALEETAPALKDPDAANTPGTGAEEEDESEDEFPPDYERSEQEEDDDNFMVEPRRGSPIVEDDDEEEDDAEEGEDVPKENKNEPPEDPTEHPIVSTGKSRAVA